MSVQQYTQLDDVFIQTLSYIIQQQNITMSLTKTSHKSPTRLSKQPLNFDNYGSQQTVQRVSKHQTSQFSRQYSHSKFKNKQWRNRQQKQSQHKHSQYQYEHNGNTVSKLQEKVTKLKQSLKSSQKHNEQLHSKLKHYKQAMAAMSANLNQNIVQLELENKQLKAQIATQKDKDKQMDGVLAIGSFGSLGKIGYQAKIRDLQIQCKTKDMKIVQLQSTICNQKQQLANKQKQLDQHQQQQKPTSQYNISNNLQQKPQSSKALSNLQSHLQLKQSQCQQHHKQIVHLKQSLKDMIKKFEKSNSLVQEQTQRNRQLTDELQDSKKKVQMMGKEATGNREICDRMKVQAIQRLDIIRKLQKQLITHQLQSKHLSQKHTTLQQEHTTLQQQFKSLLQQYQQASSKYSECLTNNYQLQRDFQRELHTIVKELTRRHVVGRAIVQAMGTTMGSTGALNNTTGIGAMGGASTADNMRNTS